MTSLSSDFVNSQRQQLRNGVRRLLALSGEPDWCQAQALTLCRQLDGDWLWIGSHGPEGMTSLPAGKVRTLLGREFTHAIFDARRGLDVEAWAMAAGTLRAGSWLILLVPEWQSWPDRADEDSLRWSERPQPIATPHFVRHLQQHLLADDEAVIWRQGATLAVRPLHPRPDWRPADGDPTARQQRILQQLSAAAPGVYVVTAPRGRGKSALAGMLSQRCTGICWATAPSRSAADVLQQHAREDTRFWAPDALLEHCRSNSPPAVDWLLVDEAAAIPSSLLTALLSHFPRILMTTTVQGYEGTGRGFLLKFCASLPQWQVFTLDEPLRWAKNDPLERVLDNVLLFTESYDDIKPVQPCSVPELREESADDWLRHPQRLQQCYALLCSAHYRTSPLDLRRLLDAPGMRVCSASVSGSLNGVLWMVGEGGLSAELAHEVWAGRRRPRGNLVAQSLAAHAGQWTASMLRSRRISRIAITAAYRRQGIGRALVEFQQRTAQAQGVDYLSVSFGYQPDLWAFWRSCGFQLVRIGSHLEASSGCYSAMALLPLSAEGQSLTAQSARQLKRDWFWLRRLIPLDLPLPQDEATDLDREDWRTLAGFAFAHRPMESSLASLSRLALSSPLALPALRLLVEAPGNSERGVKILGLPGKKALLRQWRDEVAEALRQRDTTACIRWRDWVEGPQPDQSDLP
ncbi:tRNA(Met) cytidine acetyltransferase [Brenneria goodwinii]|uniref:tRNA(Met) cytidine acetyltransferase TmcA n=1 Tax=Brenneria goodwinii TaxID=1109412 RepID=UPI000EF1A009|nr:GNAT family N-acetyltransferase [Brenneria goodwinii]MCG8156947.1 tRNA(Met) cytidine acetyltransferase [Brenneria goodwinii]MCG8161532.1 tRNA(Met) cytidine acetyltransferase [Brenneria goodwinii]MCG8165579.1 tRNA(Met) cytidine acetyltransferase [Brenneria goodwinii]MCG8170067.1 tRNA(Met) cytidine acetyltransferase [Brenneria goodwinii]MCG8174277.1 tRNA(Met) cytidine acetyltransferase [Brenneria goodwinii]